MDPQLPPTNEADNQSPGPEFAYDRVDYPGAAEEFIHLQNLAVVTALAGIQTEEINGCRVLELGCADGTNLLPSAAEFPGSEFTGVDLAGSQIGVAREVAATAGLTNVAFHHASVRDLGDSLGLFDYILCPGIFSWISDEDRMAILRLCRDCLSPNGVAVISYNALPGWGANASLREFLRFHVRDISDPKQQISEARNVIEFLAAGANANTMLSPFYTKTRDHLRTKNDAYLYHEYLADHNEAFYFHQFNQLAIDHGLNVITDADFKHSSGFGLEPTARTAIARAPSLDRQQVFDFLVSAHGRRSVLVHANRQPHRIGPDILERFAIALAEPFADINVDPSDPQPATFRFEHGNVTITDTALKAAITMLKKQWPNALPFDTLYAAASDHPSVASPQQNDGRAALAQSLLAIYGAGLIKVFAVPPRLVTDVSNKPRVSELVQCTASRGLQVVNQWHQNIPNLSEPSRRLLSKLDGTRDVTQLSAELHRAADDTQQVAESLHDFASKRLLIA